MFGLAKGGVCTEHFFHVSLEEDHLPIRLLDNFSVHLPEDDRCLVPVDAVQFTYPRPVATGVVLPPDGNAVGEAGKQAVDDAADKDSCPWESFTACT